MTPYYYSHAIQEGHKNKARKEYFESIPQLTFADEKKMFDAGFDRGWEAAKESQAALIDAIAEVIRISDRKHNAWDRVKSELERLK